MNGDCPPSIGGLFLLKKDFIHVIKTMGNNLDSPFNQEYTSIQKLNCFAFLYGFTIRGIHKSMTKL